MNCLKREMRLFLKKKCMWTWLFYGNHNVNLNDVFIQLG